MKDVPTYRIELYTADDKLDKIVQYYRGQHSDKKLADYIEEVFRLHPKITKARMEEPIKLENTEVSSRHVSTFRRLINPENGYSYYDIYTDEPGYRDPHDKDFDTDRYRNPIKDDLQFFATTQTGLSGSGGHPQTPQPGKTYNPGPKKQPFQQELDSFLMNCEKSHDAFIEIHAMSLYKMVKRETNNYNQSIELLGRIASSHDPVTIEGRIIHETEIMLDKEIDAMYHKLLEQEYEPF